MKRPAYFFHQAISGLGRNLGPSLVATATIGMALLIMGAFLLVYHNLQIMVDSSSTALEVSIYLKDGLPRPAVDRLKKDLSALPGLKSLKFVDKDEALIDLKHRLGNQGALLDGLDENPLPASFELELAAASRHDGKVEALMNQVKGMAGVDEVRYAWEWAERLLTVTRLLRAAGFGLGGLLFVAIVFIIASTIKLAVLARQEELEIMRLVGATEWFVRAPFVLEGAMLGLVGGLAALGGLALLFQLLISRLELPLGLSLNRVAFLPLTWCWLLVLAGVLLGLVGCLVSLWKFDQN